MGKYVLILECETCGDSTMMDKDPSLWMPPPEDSIDIYLKESKPEDPKDVICNKCNDGRLIITDVWTI